MSLELDLNQQGYNVYGLDEVGRGCIAGPVYAACVRLDFKKLSELPPKQRVLIRDSKKLSSKQRLLAQDIIESIAIDISLAHSEVHEIDEINILQASLLAMRRAAELCNNLDRKKSYFLLDGNQTLKEWSYLQASVIGGDQHICCIAAASIIAKNARDQMMQNLSLQYPNYGFEKHVGYGTKRHLEALTEMGATPIHRTSFAPVKRVLYSVLSEQRLNVSHLKS